MSSVCNGRLGSCSQIGFGARGKGSKGVQGVSSLRLGSRNIGSLTGKSIASKNP